LQQIGSRFCLAIAGVCAGACVVQVLGETGLDIPPWCGNCSPKNTWGRYVPADALGIHPLPPGTLGDAPSGMRPQECFTSADAADAAVSRAALQVSIEFPV
jgi:hypothetical protein